MNTNEILTFTIVLTALFAYINHRLVKWPATIGVMVFALIGSLLIAISGYFFPGIVAKANQLAGAIDFREVVLNFLLSFLLFAGSIQLDAQKLKRERWPILVLSTLGIIISTTVIGSLSFLLFSAFKLPVSYIDCLLLGALISPTDPIAVMSILRKAAIPASLEIKITGESLFNDGVAIVVFVTLAEMARSEAAVIDLFSVGKLFLTEAVGGLMLGALIGYAGFYAIRAIDDYKVEVLVTLALVSGGYFIAGKLHLSGPLAMVVAGIITGNKVQHEAMSDITRDYLGKFWELIDEILNAVLFLLIGLEMLVLRIHFVVLLIGLIVILIVLLARWVSVYIPVLLLRYKIKFEDHAIAILTWGGLRGGLSVALALSLDESLHRNEFVQITYIVVVFSILVQGLTIGKFSKMLLKR